MNMAELIGKTIGGYQIIEQIGKGGMAAIYKAYQPSLERDVAIKILHPYFSEQDPSFNQRFKREARAIARLRHPNILMIHDFGEQDEMAYIVMEYVHAGTYKDILAEGLPTLKETYTVISQVAGALDYAHSQGVVHRDVKPSNILMPKPDWALLTDFGLAKIIGGSYMTQSGITVGTPAYMSPEQGSGGKVDHRSDIYSLGIMLYEMAVGEVPYTAETPMAVVVKHIVEPLPIPRDKNPFIPEQLQRIILKSLAKNPDDRYQHAGEISGAMEAVVSANPDWSASTLTSVQSDGLETEKPLAQTVQLPEETDLGMSPQPHPINKAIPLTKKPKKRRWPFYATLAGLLGMIALIMVFGTLSFFSKIRDKRQAQNATEQSSLVLTAKDTLLPDGERDLLLGEYDDLMQAGQEYLNKGQMEKAIKAFQAALMEKPERWEEFLGIVHMLRFEKQDIPLAAQLLQEGLRVMPTRHDPEAQEFLGWMYMDIQRYQEAQQVFNNLVKNVPGFEGGYMGLFESFLVVDQPGKAISIVEEMLKQYPDEPGIPKALISLYNKMQQPQKALIAYQRAIELNSDDPWIYIEAAYAYQALGQREQAEIVLDRALAVGGRQADILERAGNIFYELGDLKRAEELLAKAIDANPDLVWAYVELAQVLIAQEREAEALPLLQKASQNHKEDIWLLLTIGQIYQEFGDCENAVRMFRLAIEINPEFVEAEQGLEACSSSP